MSKESAMHAYAQTNVQLFNQLQSEGYSARDRELVRLAYEFAMGLFTGLFLPSGKTFIDHLVGTASILTSLHVPVEVVAASVRSPTSSFEIIFRTWLRTVKWLT